MSVRVGDGSRFSDDPRADLEKGLAARRAGILQSSADSGEAAS